MSRFLFGRREGRRGGVPRFFVGLVRVCVCGFLSRSGLRQGGLGQEVGQRQVGRLDRWLGIGRDRLVLPVGRLAFGVAVVALAPVALAPVALAPVAGVGVAPVARVVACARMLGLGWRLQ